MGYKLLSCPHSLHLSFKDHSNEVQTCVNIHFMMKIHQTVLRAYSVGTGC